MVLAANYVYVVVVLAANYVYMVVVLAADYVYVLVVLAANCVTSRSCAGVSRSDIRSMD